MNKVDLKQLLEKAQKQIAEIDAELREMERAAKRQKLNG
jgi:hypothetical protein